MLTAEVMDQYIRENAEAPTKPAAGPVDETGGSYDYEKLQAVLELWAQRNEGFEWIATNTSKGPGFRISCPGATGWPDGAVHSESSAPLNGSAVCWVENGHPRFTCKHAHCGDGAPQGKKTWKHLAECLGRSAQREVLTGSPLLSSQTLLDLSVRPVLLTSGEAPWNNAFPAAEGPADTTGGSGPSMASGTMAAVDVGAQERTAGSSTEQAAVSPSGVTASHVFKFTDLGNAERFHVACSDRFRHTPDQGWFAWDGRRWSPEGTKAVMLAAAQVARGIQDEVKLIRDTGDPVKDKELAAYRLAIKKWGNASESRGRMEAMVVGASNIGIISAKAADFDTDDYLLNVQNGTLDLRSGQLLSHTRGHLITALSPVSYVEDAECPIWEKFLSRIMQNNEDLVRFLQVVAGYTLSGSTEQQCFFIHHGNGANGKSTFLETLKWLMGDYGMKTPMGTFRESKQEGVRNDLAALKPARMVIASETSQTMRINEALIKEITGSEGVTARFLFKELFTYQPRFKIHLGTNHKPRLLGNDTGLWRRVKLIPWNVTIPDEEKDLALSTKLRGEGAGILAWAVRGWREYQKGGMVVPTEVVAATADYRADEDFIGKWLADECEIGEFQSPSGELFLSYTQAAQNAKERPVNAKLFKTDMERRGFISKHTKTGTAYLGIKVRGGAYPR